MLSIANLSGIGLTWCRCQLITPFISTIGLTTEFNIGCRHLNHRFAINIRKTVNNLFVTEKINCTSFARLQTEVGVKALAFLVAIDDGIPLGSYGFVGQRPSLTFLVFVAYLVIFEIDSGGSAVI